MARRVTRSGLLWGWGDGSLEPRFLNLSNIFSAIIFWDAFSDLGKRHSSSLSLVTYKIIYPRVLQLASPSFLTTGVLYLTTHYWKAKLLSSSSKERRRGDIGGGAGCGVLRGSSGSRSSRWSNVSLNVRAGKGRSRLVGGHGRGMRLLLLLLNLWSVNILLSSAEKENN